MAKGLSQEQRERLRAALQDRVLPRFGPDPDRAQSAAARALRVHPSSINRLVTGGAGGSLVLVEKVSRFLNDPPDVILWGKPAAVRKLRELPGYQEAFDEARRRIAWAHPGLSLELLESAGDNTVQPEPDRISAELLIYMALAQQRSEAPPPKQPRKTRARR